MNFKDFVYLQRNDRQALLVISSVMVISCLLVFIIGKAPLQTAENDIDSTQTTIIRQATQQQPAYYHDGKALTEAFPFDPNTADSTCLKRLGFKPWQIKSILHYRAKGGVYSRPSDLARIYGMTKKQYEALLPFIKISDEYKPASDFYGNEPYYHPTRYSKEHVSSAASSQATVDTNKYSYPHKLKAGQTISINTADTTELQKIPGIGAYYARRIISYRDRLGGFASIEQLKEIEDIPETALVFMTIDTQQINKLNINKLTLNQLRKHPYINFYQAKAICDYRRIKGPLKSLAELKLLKDFPPAEIERLQPYVSY